MGNRDRMLSLSGRLRDRQSHEDILARKLQSERDRRVAVNLYVDLPGGRGEAGPEIKYVAGVRLVSAAEHISRSGGPVDRAARVVATTLAPGAVVRNGYRAVFDSEATWACHGVL